MTMAETATAKIKFVTAKPAEVTSSKLVGKNLYNNKNETIGQVEDLVIDAEVTRVHHDFHVPVQTADLFGGLTLRQVGHHGQRGARDRTTIAVPLHRGEVVAVQRDAQSHLVATRGVHLVR